MEVRSKFKGLDLINRVPDELWTEVRDIVQETIPIEKKWKKAKWLSGEALQGEIPLIIFIYAFISLQKRKAKEKRKDISI